MLASINPLGERGRGNRWGWTVSWYTGGSLAGGLLVGAVAGALGVGPGAVLDPAAVAATVLVAAGLGIVLDARWFGLALPTIRRQVNEDWLRTYRAWLYGAGFGFQLGLGVVTIVTTSTVYLTLVLAFLSGDVVAGAAIGAVFGLARALPVFAVARARDPAGLRAVLRRTERLAPVADRVARVSVAGLAAVAALVLLT
jgi:sulfite exporter TauE/SafE